MTSTIRKKSRRSFIPLAVILAATTAAGAWMWFGRAQTDHGAADCWAVLSETGTASPSGPVDACGSALETAITGKPAGQPAPESPTKTLPEENSRALEIVVTEYTREKGAGGKHVAPEIRKNLANALTYYRSDVYQILGSQVSYASETVSTEPNDIDLDKQELGDFLVLLAPDEAAFQKVREAIGKEIEREISQLDRAALVAAPQQEPGKPQVPDKAFGLAGAAGQAAGKMRYAAGRAMADRYKEGSDERATALRKDETRYGLPHLTQELHERAAEVGVPQTPETAARMAEIVEELRRSYEFHAGPY
ncbi:hypothetical protein [Streptomyces sp. CC228A]|uniref:hypothetical protein n=1 Tax=Streptomyces sp. CC228A TaxID=2898186 RepID=UPI001F1FC42F|nr:hypothetical protein [Streptomyces sp. CC228A]